MLLLVPRARGSMKMLMEANMLWRGVKLRLFGQAFRFVAAPSL
jgi:hypothetical protein